MDQRVQHQPRPAPPPEEDILYQWRLARKMERAQEQAAKWGPAKGTRSLGSSQPRFTHSLSGLAGTMKSSSSQHTSQRDFVHQRQDLNVSAPSVIPVVPPGTASLSATTETTFTTPIAVTSDKERIPPPMVPSQYGITSQPQVPILSGQHSQLAPETSHGSDHVIAPSLEPSPVITTARPVISGQARALVTEANQFESADVPSHMHLSCDILPCPHQRTLIEKAKSDQTIKLPLSSPVVESMLEELNVAERDIERDQQPQRTVVRESHEKAQIQGLPGRKRNGAEDKQASSSAELQDSERVAQRKKKIPEKQKTKLKKRSPQEPAATDVLSGIIGEVISM